MKEKIKIGVVCLARNTYDVEAAIQLYKNTQKELNEKKEYHWIIEKEVIIEDEDAIKSALKFKAEHIQALILISGTFHLGTLALKYSQYLSVPILLWGYPELPYDGGKIRLNSLCGVNLDASNLYKANKKSFHTSIRSTVDEAFLDAIKIQYTLNQAHIGIIGHHAQGFYNIDVDELSIYHKFGILIDHYELNDIFHMKEEEHDVEDYMIRIKKIFDLSDINEAQLSKTAILCAKIKKFYHQNKLDGLAIRCWPEFANGYGISPCAAMSILQGEEMLLACEGDIDGLISMMVHQALGLKTPFLADLSHIDQGQNTMLLWHCGVAPITLWDGVSIRSLDTYFAQNRGVTTGFVLKQGHVQLLRFDSVHGKYRIFICEGDAIPMQKELRGTYANVKLNAPVMEVFNKVAGNGIAHHFSMSYGHVREAIRMYAKLYDFPLIEG